MVNNKNWGHTENRSKQVHDLREGGYEVGNITQRNINFYLSMSHNYVDPCCCVNGRGIRLRASLCFFYVCIYVSICVCMCVCVCVCVCACVCVYMDQKMR